ncbi:MAG: FAD-binding oxidoreductase [Deltaproteobacteria bacterium]|nr:FAD-binding oxidoreductase [Deltaproteobacteria bacterium]
MDIKELRSRVTGAITTADDSHYERLRRSMVWNQLVPQRHPRIIVQAANENAVAEAVRYARSNGMKVAVRGGGHSWAGLSLCDDSLLIDLGRLKNVSLDRDARIAVIQPAVTSRDFNRRLAAEGLAFPVGHCPTVPMSGFLLNGGIGCNFNAWGPSCLSIEAARVVTAEGNLVVASAEENEDLLWAVRGAGPGFFGVVTEYTLQVFPAPGAIMTSNYYYPLELAAELGGWVGGIARELPKQVELTIFLSAAPASIADSCKASRGWVCSISATAFAESMGAAASMLKPLDSCPLAAKCLLTEANLPTPIETLHDMNAISTPKEHRSLVDTLWTNSPPMDVLATSREHFLDAPSLKSIELMSFSTGAQPSQLPDCAYSMSGDALLICSAVWEQPEDDAANAAWHRATVAALDKYAIGHYIGESDIVADPGRAERSYSKSSWQRLKALREKYDPDELFHGAFSMP